MDRALDEIVAERHVRSRNTRKASSLANLERHVTNAFNSEVVDVLEAKAVAEVAEMIA
jgi:hypothetical protein